MPTCYIFNAAEYHGDCVVEVLVQAGELSPAARDMPPDEALWQGASANAIDMDDESSYDSDEWPKEHLGPFVYEGYDEEIDGQPRHCDRCLAPLAKDPPLHLDSGPRDNTPLCGAMSFRVTNEHLEVACDECVSKHEELTS